MLQQKLPELVCPAGSLPALKAAVDHGADTVYFGYKNDTNARNFAGLNFDQKAMVDGIRYAHDRGRHVLMAINTFPQPDREADWHKAVDGAADLGVDAVILADVGLLDYASRRHPNLRLHLSVQGSATSYEAVNFAQREFGVRRAVLPRVLTLPQVEHVIQNTTVEIEVFGFGSLCVMNEGRCWLSSYATGESPNTVGACSPAKYVQWEKKPGLMNTRLNGILIDQYRDNEPAGYPTLCKGRFEVRGETYYALEEPTSLNVLEILPDIARIGVSAIKVEGRQRSPTYVAQVTRTLRAALDAYAREGERFRVQPAWMSEMACGDAEHAPQSHDAPLWAQCGYCTLLLSSPALTGTLPGLDGVAIVVATLHVPVLTSVRGEPLIPHDAPPRAPPHRFV